VANRRPIRSAFRKPMRFSRRAKPGDWATESWAAPFSLNRNDTSSYSLLQYSDYEGASTLLRRHATIKRVVCDLGIQLRFREDSEATTASFKAFTLYWGCCIVDEDDTDLAVGILPSTQHTLLQSSRFIQVGQETVGMSPWLSGTTSSVHNFPINAANIRFDWRGRARLNPDDKLVLIVNIDFWATDADEQFDNWTAGQLAGFTRVLTKVY